ncbi:MAG: FeoB-associated Cys-rich membrane protein [Siphonobacter sp.]
MEIAVIAVLFIGAVAYIGNLFRKQFNASKTGGCAKGCGTCAASKLNEIEQQSFREQ